MKILFLGDIIGTSGCNSVKRNLSEIILENQIDFTVVNGENTHDSGKGITENISNELFSCGIDVITTGNHVWDQKEILEHIKKESRLLRPLNMSNSLPGRGFGIFNSRKGLKIGVLNLMGNVFMKKSENVFNISVDFINKYILKKDYDFLIVDFHAETTSEKMAMGHLFDGHATLVVGTHTHIPTSDFKILEKGTAYQTDAGMCGNYNSVIGMEKINSLNHFLNKKSERHYPATNDISICGIIVEADEKSGLASKIKRFQKEDY